MTDINKQRFLAELGKLLTFMYEEDRQEALAMYSDMFDSGADEQMLLHQLVSPTRQAVVIARAYNQRERTLQTSARTRSESYYEDSMDDVPGYVIAIEDIRRQILGAQESERMRKEQMSLFKAEDIEEQTAEQESEAVIALPAEEEAEQEQEEAAEETDTAAVEPASLEEDVQEISEEGAVEELSVAQPEEITEEEESQEGLVPVHQGGALESYDGESEAYSREDGYPHEPKGHRDVHHHGPHHRTAATERRARPLLLILYVLIAVPVGLVGGLIMLLPIILFLALSVLAIWMGVSAVAAAFGGFAMFSDLMVVLGAGLVLLALGLLFLWLFIWFIGGVLAGFINGLISLGGRLCYKEVEVE